MRVSPLFRPWRPAPSAPAGDCKGAAVKRNRCWPRSERAVWVGMLALAISWVGNVTLAQTFLENHPEAIPNNLRSYRGVPLSSTSGTPAGSDGRAPTSAQQSGDGLPTTSPTTGQLQGVVGSSGGLALNSTNIGSATDFSNIIVNVNMPRGVSNGVASIVLRRAYIGAPYLGQQISFLFGSVIPVPSTDESGNTLTSTPKENYWLPQPYSTNDHANAGYYWSEHAQQVFAIQPGPISITWQKAVAESGNFPNNTNYVNTPSGYYRLYTVRYLVSGSAVKPPKKMYWTEGIFSSVGKKITVPPARVNNVKIVYNSSFPERVAEAYQGPGEVLPAESTNLFQEKRTLWFDRSLGVISAYNQEGRVFVELLGDTRNGSAHYHLGFEIVDVYREATPDDVTIELGEKLTAYTTGASDAHLVPDPLPSSTGQSFALRHTKGGSDRPEFYATRETLNLNDYLVHWLETGEAGLLWPSEFVRYKLIWPSNPAKYSHYVRPLAASEAEARETAVPLPTENAPLIEYQDPLDKPRANLTEDFKFYTFLDTDYPAQRALLRFTVGDQIAFERVFSWLDVNLKGTNIANTVATNLTGWNASAALQTIVGSTNLVSPRVVEQTVDVGQRITAPVGEMAAVTGLDYLAGHVRQSEGTSYSSTAYIDPFAVGFEEAKQGSIIPVNSINDSGRLEVWWFRPSSERTVSGIRPVYWPSVIGRYSVRWPTNASEIVLASNDGSGGLSSLEAAGQIYFQNDASLPGYNPNEEHALMQGGQVYALRDDLNITSGTNYSSQPFVLLEYTAQDGRPAVHAFKVLREKGGVKFSFAVTAGTLLQPPMPLPLMEKPLAPVNPGSARASLNYEAASWTVTSSSGTVPEQQLVTTNRPLVMNYQRLALQNTTASPIITRWFFPTNVNGAAKTLTGIVSEDEPYDLNYSTLLTQPTQTTRWKFAVTNPANLSLNESLLLAAPSEESSWPVTVISTNQESGLNYVVVEFLTTRPALATNATVLVRPASTVSANQFANWRLATEKLPENISDTSSQALLGAFTWKDRKGGVWVYRGPHQAGSQPYLAMQFYYKTLAGFYFPSLSISNQPPVGTITPYLRPKNTDQTYAGDPVYGNQDSNNQEGDGNPLPIYYRPVWPEQVPVLHMAETLTLPKRGLPSARGQSSLQLLYQQSQAVGSGDLSRKSAVLHDPTREKVYEMAAASNASLLDALPDGIARQVYAGRTYFPNLPPHLVERFYFDPNRGSRGALVFKGQFVDSPVGDDYLLLNVLGVQDSKYLRGLCPDGDTRKQSWDTAITSGLKTTVQFFTENRSVPGTYIPSSDTVYGPSALSEITAGDMAVDSYALTAIGPGTGYLTLLAGNGRAFTPPDDPVSMHIVKVVDTLYRGEVKPVLSSNPLNEKVTLQQVVDLAGAVDQYEFQWLITSPVDGLPPVVYENKRQLLLGNGTWNHVKFPLATDTPFTIQATPSSRVAQDVTVGIAAVNKIPFTSVFTNDAKIEFMLPASPVQKLGVGNQVVMRSAEGIEMFGTVYSASTTNALVSVDEDQFSLPLRFQIAELVERIVPGLPQGIVFREFTVPVTNIYSQLWLSLDLDNALGAKVYLDGQLAAIVNMAEGNTAVSSAPTSLAPLSHVYQLGPELFSAGTKQTNGTVLHRLAVELFSLAIPGEVQNFNARLEAFEAVDQTSLAGTPWLALDSSRHEDGVRAIMGGSADVRSLSDNYLIMRYRATNATHASFGSGWSQWTEPQLVEGWIKRVLAGINPFNQRVSDLFNNRVNTDVSILTQAGPRWEGDVALNQGTINNYGLIEIYETILRRGKGLSIDAGINFGPANDALLLAAGYLNDLYMMLGNEATADAANPTIGIGTKDQKYGDIATALFAFKGQTASLLEEELALLRGRDDFLQPGVETAPVYNRLFWNYTRGIDAGEVIYALNYNIKENNDTGVDGVINADDARKMYPQGHGDAYGHYLTALKNYYSLLLDEDFDWVPRAEAVTILGKAVQVDYEDERKFASAAAGVARTGRQVFDLTWRKDYEQGSDTGWEYFSPTRDNTRRNLATTRYWGMDHWAARTMQGAYLNWVVGNAIVPPEDPDPTHEGIQKIQRSTVPELVELTTIADDLQASLDNAEGHLSPLGLPENGIAFDINPSQITGDNAMPHFEQIYQRAKGALNNALAAFDDAKDVTGLLRSEQDSLSELQTSIGQRELAYEYSLIELYGSPYLDDIGPGKTYSTDYSGPDLLHFMYVDNVQLTFPGLLAQGSTLEYKVDIQDRNAAYNISDKSRFDFVVQALNGNLNYKSGAQYVAFTLDPHGFFQKPSAWKSQRAAPGKIQDGISRIMLAHNALQRALNDNKQKKYELDRQIEYLNAKVNFDNVVHGWDTEKAAAETAIAGAIFAAKMVKIGLDTFGSALDEAAKVAIESIPKSTIVGVAVGGDTLSAARGAILATFATTKAANDSVNFAKEFFVGALQVSSEGYIRQREADIIGPLRRALENQAIVLDMETTLNDLHTSLFTINQRVQELDDAYRNYQGLLAQGDRILQEREIFRQRSAALVQGFRTRDAAFRIFRDEKLERYKTLFDLASRYAFLAANAYDYETGLLYTSEGRAFMNRIINARALGVVRNGEPQYAGSNTGDPGLSSALAEMKADWDVLKGRLGFNNPDAYGTTVSLRTENFRVLPGTEGDQNWKDILLQGRKDNLLDDADVRRYCMQIQRSDGLPVPGIVLDFETSVADGLNLFGRSRAAGDHWYSPSSFATKIFSVGVAFEGYKGMDDPVANSTAVNNAGGASPGDPSVSFLNTLALGATPYVYLIPVGVDSMRSPPLGDESVVRSWEVADVTVPLPFNIGASGFSTQKLWQSSDSLTEQLFGIRKHQAFRPVSTAAAFTTSLYGMNGQLLRSQFTNNRLVGRSVWNSRWKLVVPGRELLSDPQEGLDRFVRTVKDVKLHFVTYSYSGN